MSRSTHARVSGFCALASSPLLVACNAVLGIAEPSGQILEEVPDASGLGLGNDDAPRNSSTGDAGIVFGTILPPAASPRARWPMPTAADSGLPHTQMYKTAESGVVRDERTQLEWQQKVDGTARTHEDAKDYCETLSLAGGGFRLPSRIELASVLDLTQPSPAIDAKAFPSTPPERFWTSSGYRAAPESAWVVSFSFSTSHVTGDSALEKHLVRCVRESEDSAPGAASAPEAGDNTVRDTSTGLEWQRYVVKHSIGYQEAVEHCALMDLEGARYRLPTLKELHTLVDESRVAPATDTELFPETPARSFWTQTQVANFGEYTWTVDFQDGSDLWVSAPTTALVRCVRNLD
ncbi:MAG: hypothetical protein RL385_2120 [Pseudomonadota bacterium]